MKWITCDVAHCTLAQTSPVLYGLGFFTEAAYFGQAETIWSCIQPGRTAPQRLDMDLEYYDCASTPAHKGGHTIDLPAVPWRLHIAPHSSCRQTGSRESCPVVQHRRTPRYDGGNRSQSWCCRSGAEGMSRRCAAAP